MNRSTPSRSFPSPSALSRAAAPFAAAVLGAAFVASLGATPVAAQDERIVGIWQKDYSRSDAPFPGRPDRPQPNPVDTEVDISLVGKDVVMKFTLRRGDWPSPVSVDANYVTNNKAQQAPDFRGGMREVRARWRKKKLTVSYTIQFGPVEADVQETWEISKDGKDLLQTNFGRTASEGRPDIRKTYYVPASDVQ